jgi:hypothetical protein
MDYVLLLSLLTGLALAAPWPAGIELNYPKIGVKLVILIIIGGMHETGSHVSDNRLKNYVLARADEDPDLGEQARLVVLAALEAPEDLSEVLGGGAISPARRRVAHAQRGVVRDNVGPRECQLTAPRWAGDRNRVECVAPLGRLRFDVCVNVVHSVYAFA